MFLSFRPAVGKELIQFAGLHGVDSGEHVGQVCDRIDVIALAGTDEGKVDSHRFTAGIRPYEQKVFSRKNKRFDCPFGRIVVDVEIWIAEKAVESNPMLERVFDSFHEGMCWMKGASEGVQPPAQFLRQWFGFPTPDCKPVCCRFAFDLALDFVEVSVDFNYFVANFIVPSARMSTAAGFGLSAIFEKFVEAAGGICLDDAAKLFEKLFVSEERQIGREIEDDCRVSGVTAINGHLAFAHFASGLSVLNFDRAVVRLDDTGIQDLCFEALEQWLDGQGASLEPIAQSGAWNGGIFAFEDFRLAVLWLAVFAFVHNGRGKQAGAWQRSRDGRAGFFSGNDILLAFRTCTNFLLVLKALDALQDLFQLIAGFIFDEDRFDLALRTEPVGIVDLVRHRLGRHILTEDMLGVVAICWWLWFVFYCNGVGGSRFWIMALGLRSEIFSVALFLLLKQFVELGLQVDQKSSQLSIAFERLLKLVLELDDGVAQGGDSCPQLGVFFFQTGELLAA